MTSSQLDHQRAYGLPPTGFRLPDATRLGSVHLDVADLDRSLAYYGEVLGFRILDRSAAQATLGAIDGSDPLVILNAVPGARPIPQEGRLGLYHFAILLPDRAALGRFAAHLAKAGIRAGDSDHLVSEALYLRDPDGLGIEVYADRPRTDWAIDDREVRMDVKPLNRPDLLRAAGVEPWAGMPFGTVIGHVHLRVGDLDQAATFFQQALGLDLMVWSYPGALFLAAGGYHHHLGVNTWAGLGARAPEAGDARLLEWTILVPSAEDADRAAASIRAAGFEVTPAASGWRVADPWGTVLLLRSDD